MDRIRITRTAENKEKKFVISELNCISTFSMVVKMQQKSCRINSIADV